MLASELVAMITKEINRRGDQQIVVNDSHGNTCDVSRVEFIRYAHPVFVLHAEGGAR